MWVLPYGRSSAIEFRVHQRRQPYIRCSNIGEPDVTPLKIRRIGKSLGVVLPEEVLKRLNLKEGDQLLMTDAPDGSLRLARYRSDFEEQAEIAREAMGVYQNALRKLAR